MFNGRFQKGHKMTEEMRRKISQKMKGKKQYQMTDKIRLKISKSKIGCKSPSYWLNKKMSQEHKKKLAESHCGEKNYLWKKDRTQLVKNEKKHLDCQYREWMLAVKNRDNWKCKINNNDCSGRLESHHILNWKDYPELRYEINNGITLCHAHHPRGREKESELSPYFQTLVAEMK